MINFDEMIKELESETPLTSEELRAKIELCELNMQGKEDSESEMEWIGHCAKIAAERLLRGAQEESSSQEK